MLDAVKRFMNADDGLEVVEWAIVGGLVVAVGAVIFALIGADSKLALTSLQTQTAAAAS